MIKVAPAAFRRNVVDRKQPPVGGPFVLGRHASLLVSAGVVSHTLWTSAAPALTYGLYAQEWHLTHTVTPAIFAVYPIFVVVMLVGFGGISDQIGRRATMMAGLFASLAGALLFAVAPDVWWVFAGRALMGFFHTLKTELVHHQHYATREEARRDIFAYIEGFYNRASEHPSVYVVEEKRLC